MWCVAAGRGNKLDYCYWFREKQEAEDWSDWLQSHGWEADVTLFQW